MAILFSHFAQKKKQRGKSPYLFLYIETFFSRFSVLL